MTEPVKYTAPRLTIDRFKDAEHVRCIFAMTPAINTEISHLMKPEYWSLVAAKLHPAARIEVLSEDNAWFAELIVMSTGPNWAKVKLLRYVQLDNTVKQSKVPEPTHNEEAPQTDPVVSSQFMVEYAGVKAKHRVVRKSDKAVLKDQFPTNAEAVKWMQEYELNNSIPPE